MKKSNWLDALENASLVGLGVGSVASLLFKEILFTTTPLSLLVALGLVNRRRLEQEVEQKKADGLAELDHRLTRQVDQINQQLVTMPAPETIHILKKGLLRKDREVAEALYGEITAVQQEMHDRFNTLEQHRLSSLQSDLNQLNGRYGMIAESITQVIEQLTQLDLGSQPTDVRAEVDHLKTQVATLLIQVETLSSQSRPDLNSLEAEVTRLDRQLSKLSPSFDLSSIRQEVSELVRIIADLVPKRDFTSLMGEIKDIHQQQESLRQSVESMERTVQEQRVSWVPNDESGRAIATSELEAIFAEFLETEKTKGSLSLDLAAAAAASAEASASVYPEIHGLATDYLNNLRTQLLTIQDFTEHLAHQQKQLRDQVNQLPKALDVVALQCQLQELSRRIPLPESTTQFKERIQEVLQNELQLINQQLQTLPNSPQYELLFDLNGTPLEPEDQGAIVAGSRAVLEEALEKAQQRLILVWPWAGQQTLDDALIRKFEAFLSKGRQLDIGWCQLTDRHEERLLSKIRRGWLADAKLQTTQESLQKFLKLKKAHPTAFQFKILGTSENFLVADQEFAVLGITDTLKTHLPFSEVQLKLRTKDAEVIQRLTRCYDHPKLADDDLTSYWNRAVTRHELGDKAGAIADYEHILHISPDDAMTYAYRGLVHYDLGNLAAASSDFSQSTLLNPHQFAAYCNRGFIHAEQGDQGAAISDYSLAIEEFPDCAIAYFYRGMAWQKLENFQEAIADYGEALRYLPETAVVHYYRGLSYQKLKQYGGALAHLEKATQIFSAQGNAVNAQKAARALTKVQQILVAHPELAIETPFTFPEPAPVNANGNSNGNSYDYANGNGNGYNDANGNGHSIDNGTPNENGNGNGKFAHSPIDAAPATSSQSIAQPPFEDQPFSLDFLNAPPAKGMKSQESEGQSAPAANGHSLPKPLTQPAKSELSEFETLINFFLSAHATAEQDWQPSPHEIASGLKKLESEASSHS